MTTRLYSIRDDKIAEFGAPVRGEKDSAMIRQFGDLILADDTRNKSVLQLHPEDFSLWFVGEFDTETGAFASAVPSCLARGSDFLINKDSN